ncbi:uncharacterized protein E1O_11880 [Burkholderiales bacterium GJ-E10]|nr:uncharacterized protein E1O_11880 [Burkholderiales bacterium GJ-E10]
MPMQHPALAHMIANSIVHGLIYGAIFKSIRHLSIAQTLILAVAGIAVVWAISSLFSRRRR